MLATKVETEEEAATVVEDDWLYRNPNPPSQTEHRRVKPATQHWLFPAMLQIHVD